MPWTRGSRDDDGAATLPLLPGVFRPPEAARTARQGALRGVLRVVEYATDEELMTTTNDTAAARAEPTEADRDEAQRILFNYAEAIEEHRASRQVACVATVARLIADQRHADTQRTTDAARLLAMARFAATLSKRDDLSDEDAVRIFLNVYNDCLSFQTDCVNCAKTVSDSYQQSETDAATIARLTEEVATLRAALNVDRIRVTSFTPTPPAASEEPHGR